MRDTCGVGSGRAPVSSSSSAVGPEPREIEEISLLIQIATFGAGIDEIPIYLGLRDFFMTDRHVAFLGDVVDSICV